MFCNWTEWTLNNSVSINWRASLVPAAAVIPAPIAYIKVVAVKKLVVGFLLRVAGPPSGWVFGTAWAFSSWAQLHLTVWCCYWEHLLWGKQSVSSRWTALNTLAWNNTQDRGSVLLVSRIEVMINRDSWGHSYLIVRGEILGFMKDELMRKHLPRMFSLIKNES